MSDATSRDRAWERAVAVMNAISKAIENDDVNITEAARAAGVAPSTFYRWLRTPPNKIDVAAIAGLADWLHETYGHEDFATLWRRTKPSEL